MSISIQEVHMNAYRASAAVAHVWDVSRSCDAMQHDSRTSVVRLCCHEES